MALDYLELIFERLGKIDESISDLRADTAEDISRLTTQMHDIAGNGQPGRLARLEEKVSNTEKKIIFVSGIVAVIGTAGHALWDWLSRTPAH